MLSIFGFLMFLTEVASPASAGKWASFREFWDHYLNYPGFELWKFINLGIFVYILVYLLKKPLTDTFKARRDVIRAELIKAEEEKQAALSSLTTVEAKLVGVDSEKATIMKNAREEVESEKRRLAEQAASEAAKLKAQAEGESARLGAVARVQLRRFAVDESLRMAEEKLRASVDANTDGRLIKSGIQAIGGLN
jgi:F0F1-type ATP synthase membrane subunit b/b'